jgi:predicted NACHT family NTPase
VSSRGFAPGTRSTLDSAEVTCLLYRDLVRKLVRLEPVVQAIVDDYERHVREQWQSDPERFIRPFLKLEGNDQPVPAIGHLARWMAERSPALMLLLGDLGTGKTTLSRFFAYQLARGFLEDPLRHPAPVLIPLRKMRKEVSLAGIVIGHFAEHGVQGLDFSRFATSCV